MTRVPLLLLCGTLALMAPLIQTLVDSNDKYRVLLTEVSTLTMEQDSLTTGRRVSSIQQLKCIGGSAGCSLGNQPRTVQCYNKGFNGNDVQWECKAELNNKYQFGKIKVSCEGYESDDDPYKLKGSCGLEYELDLTEPGKAFFGWWTLIIGAIVILCLYWMCNGDNKQKSGTTGATSYEGPPIMIKPPDWGSTHTSSGYGGTSTR